MQNAEGGERGGVAESDQCLAPVGSTTRWPTRRILAVLSGAFLGFGMLWATGLNNEVFGDVLFERRVHPALWTLCLFLVGLVSAAVEGWGRFVRSETSIITGVVSAIVATLLSPLSFTGSTSHSTPELFVFWILAPWIFILPLVPGILTGHALAQRLGREVGDRRARTIDPGVHIIRGIGALTLFPAFVIVPFLLPAVDMVGSSSTLTTLMIVANVVMLILSAIGGGAITTLLVSWNRILKPSWTKGIALYGISLANALTPIVMSFGKSMTSPSEAALWFLLWGLSPFSIPMVLVGELFGRHIAKRRVGNDDSRVLHSSSFGT